MTRACSLSLIPALALGLFACGDSDVGVRCGDGDLISEGGTGFTISQVLECRSRLCVLKEGAQDPLPRCTKICSDNGDCPGAGPNCDEGYLCRVGTVANVLGLSCCKLCVCSDDLSAQERERDEQAETCERLEIQADCPNI